MRRSVSGEAFLAFESPIRANNSPNKTEKYRAEAVCETDAAFCLSEKFFRSALKARFLNSENGSPV